MLNFIKTFAADEDGAVTVDWVVLTAAVVGLGIAVDLDYEGLIVPVIREADTKRLRAIAREIHDLANRARTKKLKPDEISGGTFTISNNGSAGSVLTMPIISQPQVAILSTDAITRRAAGRGGLEDIHFTVHGDESVARRVLKGLTFTH